MDYLLPAASDVPDVRLDHMETPSLHTPGGMKGLGEGGVIPAPAAIGNAICAAVPEIAESVTATPLSAIAPVGSHQRGGTQWLRMHPSAMGLVADGIDRSYGRTLALREVRFELTAGDIHGALVGENGAGKSTLIKVLTGVEQPDRGTIAIGGSEVSFRSPREGRRAGIAVVHQDNQVFEDLTVWENIGGTATRPATWGPLLRRGATVRRVRETLDRQRDPYLSCS